VTSERFWDLYEHRARRPIVRACERVSARLSSGRVDPDELVSWIDQRVWRLEQSARWPIFHEDPSDEEAVERVLERVTLLARWAYLARSRAHWRRVHHETAYAEEARVERLAGVSGDPASIEAKEEVANKLAAIRGQLSEELRGRIAASWKDSEDRKRVGVAIGATRDEDDELIDEVEAMKRNTVEQMRSRSLRKARELLSKKALTLLIVAGVMLFASTNAFAGGEQTGGRRASRAATPADVMP